MYLKVNNWEKFQQYKDRDPKWIKLHRGLLDDYEYSHLPDAAKAHLVGLWLLAAKLDNKIPADPKWIAVKINATTKIDLELLKRCGFIGPYSSVQNCTDMYESVPREEESREEENSDSLLFDAWWAAYPRRRRNGKAQCRKKWAALKLDAQAEQVMVALEAWKRSKDWTKDGGEFICGPHKWLNEQRYDDPPQAAAPVARGPNL